MWDCPLFGDYWKSLPKPELVKINSLFPGCCCSRLIQWGCFSKPFAYIFFLFSSILILKSILDQHCRWISSKVLFIPEIQFSCMCNFSIPQNLSIKLVFCAICPSKCYFYSQSAACTSTDPTPSNCYSHIHSSLNSRCAEETQPIHTP